MVPAVILRLNAALNNCTATIIDSNARSVITENEAVTTEVHEVLVGTGIDVLEEEMSFDSEIRVQCERSATYSQSLGATDEAGTLSAKTPSANAYAVNPFDSATYIVRQAAFLNDMGHCLVPIRLSVNNGAIGELNSSS
ncbi:hypothetical protein D9M70_467960 [compost metagenome]